MLIRPTELDIPPKADPFQNDQLERRDLEPTLTQFITKAQSPFTLALDGSWGSGKTTFLKMWKPKLEEAGHICLYLNAWKNDFVQEPLVAVVGELSEAIKALEPENAESSLQKNIEKNIEKIKKVGILIAKRAIPLAVKLGTNGIIDSDAITERLISDSTGNIAEDLIKDYAKGKSEIEEFRKALTTLVEELPNHQADTKVVIMIDELDRCRPTYAVQLLERIKHLFDVRKVVFILGIDRSQLNHSIRSLYGAEFDAVGYLRRFIDFDYRLPEPKSGSYCSYLFKSFGITDLLSSVYGLDDLKIYLGGLMSAAKMTLRQQEQTIARLRIVLQTIPPTDNLYTIPLSILLFLREWDRETYTEFVEGRVEIDQLITSIEGLPNIKGALTHYAKIEAHLLIGAIETKESNLGPQLSTRSADLISRFSLISDRFKNYQHYQQIEKNESNEPEVVKAQTIVHYIEEYSKHGRDQRIFVTTINRIALTNNFL